MEKLMLNIIVMLLLTSCTTYSNAKNEPTTIMLDEHSPLEIVIVDSCEYLYGPWGYKTVLTHKGNCKHCQQYKLK